MGVQIHTELKNEKESKQISPLYLFELKTSKHYLEISKIFITEH